MRIDPEYVRRHIEKALEEHAHGDSCHAPECCPAGDPVEFASRLYMAPPGSCGNRSTGRLPPLSRRGGGEHNGATRP